LIPDIIIAIENLIIAILITLASHRVKTMKHVVFFLILFFGSGIAANAQWVPDLGNGKYKNPVIFADYSAPDVIRVDDDFYMVASSFNCMPGIPVLRSRDLVNWKIIGHVYDRLPLEKYEKPVHGQGSWPPSIRYQKGLFYRSDH
jgi:beta-xylosidase